jgi:hypothetical protein
MMFLKKAFGSGESTPVLGRGVASPVCLGRNGCSTCTRRVKSLWLGEDAYFSRTSGERSEFNSEPAE